MHPRERVLGVALLKKNKGEPIPLDLLAELDKYGLDVSEFVDSPLPIEQSLITLNELELETNYEITKRIF
tara:strand:- start:29 stop:238 length:210 start_codon:yes stop_codon:yes gene_type:complete